MVRELSRWTRPAVLGPRFHSSRSPVPSEVPQGSIRVLLPVIQNRIALFADDSVSLKVYKIKSHSKRTWTVLHCWTDNWHLKSNTSKSKSYEPSHVSATYFRYDYELNNNSLKHVTQVKDFGVTISPDLTWDTHIDTILAKANRKLAFLRHSYSLQIIGNSYILRL